MLTEKKPNGELSVKDVDFKDCKGGMYGALCKLRDYEATGLEPDDYKRALTVTRNIKVNAEIMEQSLYEVCKGLAEVKRDKLYKPMGYSSFENYCEVEIGIKRHMAYKYVAIADIENVESIQHFGVTKLSLLAQLDEPTRQEITQNTDLENTSVKELKEKISDLKKNNDRLMSKIEESEKEAERCRKNEATACGKLSILQTDSDMLKAKNEELEKQVEKLKEHPVQVTVEDTTKIQELEEQLKETQEKYQSELEKVRKELSENRSQSLATFNAYLTSATNAMERLCDFVSVRMADENINHYKQKIELLLRCVSSKINLGGD